MTSTAVHNVGMGFAPVRIAEEDWTSPSDEYLRWYFVQVYSPTTVAEPNVYEEDEGEEPTPNPEPTPEPEPTPDPEPTPPEDDDETDADADADADADSDSDADSDVEDEDVEGVLSPVTLLTLNAADAIIIIEREDGKISHYELNSENLSRAYTTGEGLIVLEYTDGRVVEVVINADRTGIMLNDVEVIEDEIEDVVVEEPEEDADDDVVEDDDTDSDEEETDEDVVEDGDSDEPAPPSQPEDTADTETPTPGKDETPSTDVSEPAQPSGETLPETGLDSKAYTLYASILGALGLGALVFRRKS